MRYKNFEVKGWLPLILGSLAFAFIGWRYNMALAALVAPALLIRFSRGRSRWYSVLLAWPLLALGSGIAMWKAWDLDTWLLLVFPFLRALLIVVPLLLDRLASRRLGPVLAGLVFPASMVAIDYALSFSPFATVLSSAVGLYGLRELAQVASLAGIWGLGFLGFWIAPALNVLAEKDGDLRASGRAALLPLAAFGVALVFGAVRIGTAPIGAATVRVGGVGVGHPRDYWDLIDAGTPREAVLALSPETAALEETLFERSRSLTAAGAKVVVWTEGACVLNEDQEAAFVDRAKAFARGEGVYLAAAVLVLHYGSGISDNKILMFTPEGSLAFTYVKTISWYPTDSDGVLKVVETPWGRLGAAICFDMDTPAFARGLSRLGADLVVVPSFDSEKIRPFHSEVGLFRAVENGYSVFRQVAEGTSMAVDGRGIVRGMADWFSGPSTLLIADLPVKAERTLYSAIGDLFAWLDLGLLLVLLAALTRARPALRETSSKGG